jgi:hypothetical protein
MKIETHDEGNKADAAGSEDFRWLMWEDEWWLNIDRTYKADATL